MAKNATGYLRRETAALQAAATKREKDNTQAIIDYMAERDPRVADHVKRLGKRNVNISVSEEHLPWNPSAPKRVTALTLIEESPGYYPRRGETHYTRITVPHWDYNGVDPLIAREPWERTQADISCGSAANQRQWRLDAICREIAYEAQAREMTDHMTLFGSYESKDEKNPS
jgi:hypothetical protein